LRGQSNGASRLSASLPRDIRMALLVSVMTDGVPETKKVCATWSCGRSLPCTVSSRNERRTAR